MEESGSELVAAGLASTAQGPVITHAMTSDGFRVPLHTHPLVAAPAGRMPFKSVIDTKRGARDEHVKTNVLAKHASLLFRFVLLSKIFGSWRAVATLFKNEDYELSLPKYNGHA